MERMRGGHYEVDTSEFKVPSLVKHIDDPRTQAEWAPITTMDPFGMHANRPTISATPACMEIPELQGKLKPDGKVVLDDYSINIVKVAVDPVWHLPSLASKLKVDEGELRDKLAKWTQNDLLYDTTSDVYLPSLGGTTAYIFGDLSAIHDPDREVALRPHDECNGSDVFGTDICTCRPYLVYAIQGAAECAQRGGCGLIVYYRKEGRALGEVTKFRVYNARTYQEGGDRPETYFKMTENIAGIEDARCQELMPDVLKWLGVSRVDHLLSMSKDKYDAIIGADIEVVNRESLPEDWVPKNAFVEISAKISAGYNAFQPKKDEVAEGQSYLLTLDAVRERCNKVVNLAGNGDTDHFEIDYQNMDAVVNRVIKTIRRSYPSLEVPTHSRFRQFNAGNVDRMSPVSVAWNKTNISAIEQCRRRIDLAVTSVLLDAGAGADWSFTDHRFGGGSAYGRSEGLAVASLDMFMDGFFASDGVTQHVDAAGLRRIDTQTLGSAFQASDANPLIGLAGRATLMNKLADALDANEAYFGGEDGSRPGHLLDHILLHANNGGLANSGHRISVRVLWNAVIEGLGGVFPDSSGMGLGDCYSHSKLVSEGDDQYASQIPFHKLAQWLTYSLLDPLESFGIQFVDKWLLTGLAEYRNGGLLIDAGLLKCRDPEALNREYQVHDEFVVEWRALTVGLLDRVAVGVWDRLGVTQDKMPLGSVLEGGTWQAGRDVAKEVRGPDAPPPVMIISEGNVF
jgi:GTP cyclohydrolase II